MKWCVLIGVFLTVYVGLVTLDVSMSHYFNDSIPFLMFSGSRLITAFTFSFFIRA